MQLKQLDLILKSNKCCHITILLICISFIKKSTLLLNYLSHSCKYSSRKPNNVFFPNMAVVFLLENPKTILIK